MKKRLIIHHLITMAALLVFSSGLLDGSGSVHAGGLINTGYFGGIAIKGYDPVAYFVKGRAMKGSKEFAHEWLTAYGQNTANIDPEAWRIIDGKLYLNYDKGAAAELEETPGQIKKAEANWQKIKAKLPQ